MDFNWIVTAVHSVPGLQQHFGGVVEQLPTSGRPKTFYVLYVNVHQLEIGHYVGVWFDANEELVFFDPMGEAPSHYSIRMPSNVTYNQRQVQPYDSCSCGAFVLYWASECIKGRATRRLFPSNQSLIANQNQVLQWLHHYIQLPLNLTKCSTLPE